MTLCGLFGIAVPWRERGVFLRRRNEQENDKDFTPVETIPPTKVGTPPSLSWIMSVRNQRQGAAQSLVNLNFISK